MDDAPLLRRRRTQFDPRRVRARRHRRLRARPTSSTSARDGVRALLQPSRATRWSAGATPRAVPADRRRRRRRAPSTCSATARPASSGRRRCPATRRAPAALRRPDGRHEAAPARRGRATTSAPRRGSHYAPSTQFYLADQRGGPPVGHAPAVPGARRRAGRDATTASAATASSRATRYHHGYFDGVEREFRGFGMVEQWNTEEFAALSASDDFPDPANLDAASHVPPTLTRPGSTPAPSRAATRWRGASRASTGTSRTPAAGSRA